jgi:hypothetical protein
MFTAFGQEVRKDCSPSWCAYNDLKAESAASKGDYTVLANINTRLEAAITEAKDAQSGAVYALELQLANNFVRMDNTADAIPHFQAAYDAAKNKDKIGNALWNAHASVADKLLRDKSDLATAREHYLWLQKNAALCPWYEKIKDRIKYGLDMTRNPG